jgi:iron complex transport system permease protein
VSLPAGPEDLADRTDNRPVGRLRVPGRVIVLLALVLALVPVGVLSVMVGSRIVPPGEVLGALVDFDPSDDAHLVIRLLRIPRTLLGLLAGAALGMAGALMQSLTRNALAEPGTLGVNAGASAGVVVGLAFTGIGSISVYVWFAFAGAGIAALLVHRLGRAGDAGVNPVRLVLAGAGLSIMLSSLTTIVVLGSTDDVFDAFRTWVTGSLDGRGWESLPVLAVCVGIGLVLCTVLSGPLNSVGLGTDMARSLGVNIRATWALTNVGVLLLAGAATAAVGPIGFVGLAAPHVARSIAGPDHRWVLPLSALIAAHTLVIADILGRVVIFPREIGAGILTALIGAPFFIALVRRGKVSGL